MYLTSEDSSKKEAEICLVLNPIYLVGYCNTLPFSILTVFGHDIVFDLSYYYNTSQTIYVCVRGAKLVLRAPDRIILTCRGLE